jgi:Arc/MetJ-type ribon-helix-helix transcriptional regulator
MKMTERKDKTKWCIPVTNSLDKALEQAVIRDSHISKSEFVRDAVRKELVKMGYNPQVFEKTEIPA